MGFLALCGRANAARLRRRRVRTAGAGEPASRIGFDKQSWQFSALPKFDISAIGMNLLATFFLLSNDITSRTK
jgi:hypothetical protein